MEVIAWKIIKKEGEADWTIKLMDYKELGYKEGIEKGIQEGIETKTKEVVVNMLRNNIAIDVIEKIVGLNSKEIEKIKSEIEV